MKDEILFKKRNGSSSFYHKFLTQHGTDMSMAYCLLTLFLLR